MERVNSIQLPCILLNFSSKTVKTKSKWNERGIFKIKRRNREGYLNRLQEMGRKDTERKEVLCV
jgi:hypothetical protein